MNGDEMLVNETCGKRTTASRRIGKADLDRDGTTGVAVARTVYDSAGPAAELPFELVASAKASVSSLAPHRPPLQRPVATAFAYSAKLGVLREDLKAYGDGHSTASPLGRKRLFC
jgi:hypothetical protein